MNLKTRKRNAVMRRFLDKNDKNEMWAVYETISCYWAFPVALTFF